MRWLILVALVVPALAGCINDSGTDGLTDDVTDLLPVDPCVAFDGLDHACISDGLGLGETVYWGGGPLPMFTPENAQATSGETDGGVTFLTGVDAAPQQCLDPKHAAATYEVTIPSGQAERMLQVATTITLPDLDFRRNSPDSDIALYNYETQIVLSLFDPDGVCVDTRGTRGVFSGLLTSDPSGDLPAGTWTIAVDGLLEQDLVYDMRAGVIPAPQPSDEPMLPDLRIVPPFEVGFAVPTSSFNHGVVTPAAVPGASCMAEEYEEAQREGLDRPTMCLRFSMGFANHGDGAFIIHENEPVLTIVEDLQGKVYEFAQVVCKTDGTECEDMEPKNGLEAQYHTAHIHYHYQNAYIYDLYRVVGDGELEFVTTSGKLGVNPGEELLSDWGRTDYTPDQDPARFYPDGSEVRSTIDLQAGWADIYDWNRGGNYVDFPITETGQPVAGEYVLHGTTDRLDQIIELNETNNDGYTHFTVSGMGEVHVLERGYGTDPWDPNKEILTAIP